MAEVRWTPQAADDFESITNFIAKNSLQYARVFALDVFASLERLETFPNSGRLVPELNRPDIREILLGSYRIVYRIKSDTVEILTLYHGARFFGPFRLM